MTTQAFEAALKEPDSDVSNVRLHKLSANPRINEKIVPELVEKYVNAFCDQSLSYRRRRWIGLALAAMIDNSSTIGEKLTASQRDFSQLGDVILSSAELEETKIVAGIIMRSVLEKGAKITAFWSSNKVKDSVANFPVDIGPHWIQRFQDFMDALNDLALLDAATDPCLLYPVALMTSDNFQWISSKNIASVVIVQGTGITFISSDHNIQQFRFVEIPFSYILSVSSRASMLHDSQARTTEHEPWEAVLTLHQRTWTYRLDTGLRTATEICIMFEHAEDARECVNAVEELLRKASTGSALDSLTARTDVPVSVLSQNGCLPNERYHSQLSLEGQPLLNASSSQPIDISGRRSPKSTCTGLEISEQCQISSDKPRQNTAIQGNRRKEEPQVVENVLTENAERHQSSLPKDVKSQHGSTQIKDAETLKQPRSQSRGLENVKQLEPERNKSSEYAGHVLRSGKTVPSSPGNLKQKILSQRSELKGIIPVEKSLPKGRLSKVSHNPARNNAQSLLESDDVFEVPEDLNEKLVSEQNRASTDIHPVKYAQRGNRKPSHRTKQQRGEDDDEFVPSGTKVTQIGSSKRKAPTGSIHCERLHVKKPRRQPAKSTRESQPLISSARAPLISKLIDSQESTRAADSPFKKPTVPTQAIQQLSTPVQHIQQLLPRSLTPTKARKLLNESESHGPNPHSLHCHDGTTKSHRIRDPTILSSNSKPVPASPNAESAAISGHADQNDVALDKKLSEVQIAKSNPFKPCGMRQHVTKFTRRLSGEDPADSEDPQADNGDHQEDTFTVDQSAEPCGIIDEDTEKELHQAVSQSLHSLKKRLQPASQAQMTVRSQNGTLNMAKFLSDKVPVVLVGDSSPTFSRRSGQQSRHVAHRDTRDLDKLHENGSRERYQEGSPSPAVAQKTASPLKLRKTKEVPEVARYVEYTAPIPDVHDEFVDHADEFGGEDNTTLINPETPSQLPLKATGSPDFPSSPPYCAPGSSRSSTSAESEQSSKPALATSEAEEIQWEAVLQPHQRSLHEALIHVSNRVLGHIIDSETVVADVAEMFLNDGQRLVKGVMERHESEYATAVHVLRKKKAVVKKKMEAAMQKLQEERNRVAHLT